MLKGISAFSYNLDCLNTQQYAQANSCTLEQCYLCLLQAEKLHWPHRSYTKTTTDTFWHMWLSKTFSVLGL